MNVKIGSLTLRNRTDRHGKTYPLTASTDAGKENINIPHDQPRASSRINDNYGVTSLKARLLAGSTPKETLTVQSLKTNVNLNVANHVHSATGHPQRKGISPGLSAVNLKGCTLKHVKGASSVIQLPCVQSVTNVPLVVKNLPVGARLQNFWQTWLERGAGPKIAQILREGYTLPFWIRPNLTRSPTVISRYVNPHRNSYLLEALHQLMDKNAIELVHNQTSLGFFNRLFLVPKPNNKWRPILDLSKLNLFLKVEKFKMETPETIRTSLQQVEWVTSVDFKDAYFHIPIQEQSRKYLRFHVQGRTYQFKALPFGMSTAPMEFTVLAKEVKLMAIHKGIRIHQYLDDWLVRARSHQSCLHHTQILVKMCQDLGWLVKDIKIRAGAPTSVQLRRLPVRPQVRPGQTDTGPVAKPSRKNSNTALATGLSGPAVHVLDWSINSHRETSSPRPVTHETHTVASQKQLEGTGIPGKDYPSTQILAPTLTVVAKRKQCASRSTITPYKACSANFYRRIKRRVGRSFKRVHCKGVLVSAGKQAAHKLSGTKSSPLGLKRVPKPMHKQNCPSGHRQYYSSGLYKQGRGNEVGSAVCATVENLDLVFPATNDPKSPTYPWPTKCDSRQTIQAKSDHPNRMVPPSGHFSGLVQKMAPASDRPICHEVQQQVTSVCVSSAGHSGSSSGRTHPAMGGSGCIRLPTDRHIGQSGGEVTRLPVQETHSDCSGMAQHALVLGLSDHVQPGPSQPAQPAQPADTALQSDPSQKSDKPKSPCLAPRATTIKEQGFSEAVAARIEAPQRRSTRSVYEAKWAIFTKWCVTNQVDFRSPPVKSVADFLMYLFEDKKLQPSISPATISSWIKQTVILCYELSDHQAHTLHQVKAHDVRAFAFQSGVSLEQILAACHWKSHNTFTQFYLKDVAWADSELYHLGPVVAAQQIHQQTGT